eukprot:TRINITY_DN10877_c0_g2_i2.p1 TRINITY_DN10877_c0_g2~~TRINITY_DN10877_c0_g2_i2.p1  ORF type:complete len:212 (-),score=63.38 TRINITY_DN10877_c0_g2_i2:26-661(-)
MEKLLTLWVNNNKIENLTIFIDKLVDNTPNLKFLSMLRNEACPNFFNGHSLRDYNDYRYYVISRLKHLTTLDATPITDAERGEADRIYSTLATRETREEVDRRRDEEALKKKAALAEAVSSPAEKPARKKKQRKPKTKTENSTPSVAPDASAASSSSLPLPDFDVGPSAPGAAPPAAGPLFNNQGGDDDSDFSSDSEWSEEDDDVPSVLRP